jgi:hypothetical protein
VTARDANALSCLNLTVRSGNVRSGQSQRQQTDANGLAGHYQTVRSGNVRIGLVRSGLVRSGNVRSGRSQRQQTDAGIGRTSCQSLARLSRSERVANGLSCLYQTVRIG